MADRFVYDDVSYPSLADAESAIVHTVGAEIQFVGEVKAIEGVPKNNYDFPSDRIRYYHLADVEPVLSYYYLFEVGREFDRFNAPAYTTPQAACDAAPTWIPEPLTFIPNGRLFGGIGSCRGDNQFVTYNYDAYVLRGLICPIIDSTWKFAYRHADTSNDVDDQYRGYFAWRAVFPGTSTFGLAGTLPPGATPACRDTNTQQEYRKIWQFFGTNYSWWWSHRFSFNIQIYEDNSCDVSELTPLEKLVDAYSADPVEKRNTLSLEANLGNNGYSLLTPATQQAEQCLKGKVEALGLPYALSSTYRTKAYQQHLSEIWKKMESLVKLQKDNPEKAKMCATLRSKVAAAKGCDNKGKCLKCSSGSHCLKAEPADTVSKHSSGLAFDISEKTVAKVLGRLSSPPPKTMQVFLDEPKACNLRWGGDFVNEEPDEVHYYLK